MSIRTAMPEDHADETGFLHGDGEIAELIAKLDWTSTPLGPPEAWPSELKTATSMIINSPVPMAMLVGEDAIAIYNQAFADGFLGSRHPRALAARTRESRPEISDQVAETIAVVKGGRRVSQRDRELTVTRKGRTEQIWANIDCSPVMDERGGFLGVLVIAAETTERVLAQRKAALELARLRNAFEQAPGFICLLSGPDHIVQFVNEAHKRLFGDRFAEGRPYLEAFADIAERGRPELLDQVYASGERYIGRAEQVLIPTRSGGLKKRLLDHVIEPVTDDAGHVVGLFIEGFDVTARAAAAENERRLSAAVAVARLGAFEWNLKTGEATLDARAREIFGFGADEALKVTDIASRIHPDDTPQITSEARDADARGQARREFEYRICLPDGSIRYVASVSDTIQGRDGRPRRVIGLFADVTERRRAEQRQRLLINELNHRVKNTLATIQSLADQTLRSAPDIASAREALEARIVALANAHDLLTSESWHGARLSDVVALAMTPFETLHQPQISRSGPGVWLTAPQALALSLALHELATNAVKYGALSTPEGWVTLRWSVSADDEFTLRWTEQGGPRVHAPTKAGFGSRLLQRSLARELGGEVAFTFAPEGVRCTIRFDLAEARTATEPADLEPRASSGQAGS